MLAKPDDNQIGGQGAQHLNGTQLPALSPLSSVVLGKCNQQQHEDSRMQAQLQGTLADMNIFDLNSDYRTNVAKVDEQASNN
jgi:hypothetical protein